MAAQINRNIEYKIFYMGKCTIQFKETTLKKRCNVTKQL